MQNFAYLSTLQFDKVLLSVDNLDATIRHELTDIPSVEPAIVIEGFLGSFGHHIVSTADIKSLGADLPSSIYRFSIDIHSVGAQIGLSSLVADIRCRNNFGFGAWDDNSSNTVSLIVHGLKGQSSNSLRKSLQNK